MATTGSDWAAARGEKWRAHLPGMEAMFAPVDAPLIRALELDRPRRIADIGCGGGGGTLEILRQAPAGSVVHGFDIARGLIEHARGRSAEITFETADMATTPPPGELYDRLVSRFGVMFFADAPAAFANLARWLAPGGRFAFAVWGPMSENPWMPTVREIVAAEVEVPPLDPDAPGPFRYAEVDKLLALLTRAGFGELDVREWRGSLPMGGPLTAAESARFAIGAFSTFGELLAGAGDEAMRRAHEALTARFSAHEKDGAVQMGARVHIVTGAR